MEVFVIWAFLAVLVGWWADSRGRSWGGFSLLSLVASPLLAGIVLLVTKNLAQEQLDAAKKREEDAQRETERREEHERQLESIKVLSKTPGTGSASVADELMKLAKLRDSGVLTAEEFATQKAALLAGAAS